jgi:hypothetical protein
MGGSSALSLSELIVWVVWARHVQSVILYYKYR